MPTSAGKASSIIIGIIPIDRKLSVLLVVELTLSVPVTLICVNYSTVYNDMLIEKRLTQVCKVSLKVGLVIYHGADIWPKLSVEERDVLKINDVMYSYVEKITEKSMVNHWAKEKVMLNKSTKPQKLTDVVLLEQSTSYYRLSTNVKWLLSRVEMIGWTASTAKKKSKVLGDRAIERRRKLNQPKVWSQTGEIFVFCVSTC